MRSEVPTLARRSPVTPDRCCTDSSTSVLFENTTIELQDLRLSSGPHENDCMTSRYFFLSHPCLRSIWTLTSVIVVVGRISARNVPGPLGVARMRIPPHVIRPVELGARGSGRTQRALTFSVFRLLDADGTHISSRDTRSGFGLLTRDRAVGGGLEKNLALRGDVDVDDGHLSSTSVTRAHSLLATASQGNTGPVRLARDGRDKYQCRHRVRSAQVPGSRGGAGFRFGIRVEKRRR